MPLFNVLLEEALNHLKDDQFDLALTKLSQAELHYTDTSDSKSLNLEDIHILRGTINLAKGDLENAQKDFEKALKLNPRSSEASLGLGQVFYFADMLEEAATMIGWVAENYPENEVAKNALSRIEAEMNSSNKTEEYSDVEDLTKLYDNAYDCFLENNYEESLMKLQLLEKKYDYQVALLKGNVLLAQGKDELAETEFKKAFTYEKKSAPLCSSLGKLFMKKNQFNDAKNMFERALAINPEDQFALVSLAEVNEKLGFSPLNKMFNFPTGDELGENITDLLDQAYADFANKKYDLALSKVTNVEDVIAGKNFNSQKETTASLFNFKGYILLAQNKISEAIEQFEIALKNNPESSQACTGLGEIAYLEGDDQKAKTMFEWAVLNNPNNIMATSGLAKVNISLGFRDDHNSLLTDIETQLSEELNEMISKAYQSYSSKDFTTALSLINKAENLIDKNTVHPEVKKTYASLLNFKGFCLLSLQDMEEARTAFETALNLNPKSSQACAGLGEIFYLEGNDEAAKEMYEWSLRNEPLNKFASAGLEKVTKNLGTEQTETNYSEKADEMSELINKAYEHFNHRDYSAAIEKLDEAKSIIDHDFNPEDAFETLSKINNFIGFNYLMLGDNTKAKMFYEAALSENPDSSQAAAGLGELFFQEGDDEAAKQMYEWAVKNNELNNFAVRGLQRVNKNLGFKPDHNSLME